MNWISLKNQKPKVGEFVFVLLNNIFPDALRFDGNSFCTHDGLEEENVTHWMQIPPLP